MISNFVFLTPRPINSYEENKWALSYLRSQGFNIEILNVAPIFNNGNDLRCLVTDPLKKNYVHDIRTYSEFEEFVKKFASNSVFIDYLVAHSNVTLKEERIFRILKKFDAKYAVLSSGALPLPSTLYKGIGGKVKAVVDRILKVFLDPVLLFNYLVTKLILILSRYRLIYPLPSFIFGGDSGSLHRFLASRNINKNNVVPINSYDFDAAINYLRSLGNKMPLQEEICVFLDEAATHHSDFALLGIEPADSTQYFYSMNRFFDFIENSIGLKVVIAAHPRSQYESMGDVFKGRTVIKGKTIDLVAKSKLVVMHMSTSVSYAVLFNKPVMPIKIPGMDARNPMNKMVDVIAAAIGEDALDVDREKLLPGLFKRRCDLLKYAEYRDRYVKTLGADELPEWEIVANYIKKYNSININ